MHGSTSMLYVYVHCRNSASARSTAVAAHVVRGQQCAAHTPTIINQRTEWQAVNRLSTSQHIDSHAPALHRQAADIRPPQLNGTKIANACVAAISRRHPQPDIALNAINYFRNQHRESICTQPASAYKSTAVTGHVTKTQ
jgi:hypothetical protein